MSKDNIYKYILDTTKIDDDINAKEFNYSLLTIPYIKERKNLLIKEYLSPNTTINRFFNLSLGSSSEYIKKTRYLY